MTRYAIQDTESKVIKKFLKKWGEISVFNKNLNGVISIKNFRKYHYRNEVDLVFTGNIFAKVGHKQEWLGTEVFKTKTISKIKLNRFLRKSCLLEVRIRMNYFGIEIKNYTNIVKINWE